VVASLGFIALNYAMFRLRNSIPNIPSFPLKSYLSPQGVLVVRRPLSGVRILNVFCLLTSELQSSRSGGPDTPRALVTPKKRYGRCPGQRKNARYNLDSFLKNTILHLMLIFPAGRPGYILCVFKHTGGGFAAGVL